MRLFVTGTDTDVGKTVFSAALAGALDATYWKPIQSGGLNHTDSDSVQFLSGLPSSKLLPEGYRLRTPCSPHRAAELDSTEIDWRRLSLPEADPLVVEGAGGLLVPVTRDSLIIDLMKHWQLTTVLVARTALGTINHSLLSIEALHSRSIPVLGVAFVGDPVPDSEEIICTLGGVKRLGRLPRVDPLGPTELAQAFRSGFNVQDFK